MTEHRFLTGDVVSVPDSDILSSLSPHHLPWCYGCGPENDFSLGIRAHYEGDKVTADLEFAPQFQGGPGLVHGGAIAAFFDDLIGFVMLAHQQPGVTAKLEINYLRPIPLGLTVHAEAWMSRVEGRKMWAEAIGEDHRGSRYVEVKALFIHVGADHFQRAVAGVDPEAAMRLGRYEEDEYYP